MNRRDRKLKMDVGDGFTLPKKTGHTESFGIPGLLKNSPILSHKYGKEAYIILGLNGHYPIMHMAFNNNKLIMERLTQSDTQETLTRNNP